MIKKILIANRGEIACRIIKTAKKLGIKTVAVYSETDSNSLAVKLADQAVFIGESPPSQSYLNHKSIISAIKISGADAVHPGYGFLSENSEFVAKLEKLGINFIGPSSTAIKMMGDKIEAKKIAQKAKVNVVPGYMGTIKSVQDALKIASKIGYPIIIKAAAGGGGKGMRVVRSAEEMKQALQSTRNEARNNFSDERIFIEKFIENPRHIEIQLLGDKHGNYVCIGERECSIQRHNQKVIEEAPSPFLSVKARNKMFSQSVALAKKVEYFSVGTIEYIVDSKQNFYFLEMNTRLQVEHPVTELVYNIDLVEEMIKVANGEKLSLKQKDISPKGWAFESRVYAEDPTSGFLPSTGKISTYKEPREQDGIRIDSGVCEGDEVSMFYDPMLAKLCTYADSRLEAIEKMKHALGEYVIRGISSNISFLQAIFNMQRFVDGDINTNFIEQEFKNGFTGAVLNDESSAVILCSGIFIFLSYAKRYSQISGQLRGTSRAVPSRWVININGSNYPITVRPIESGYKVSFERQRFYIVSKWLIGNNIFPCKINGKEYNLQVESTQSGYDISYMGSTADVKVFTPRAAELTKFVNLNKTKKLEKNIIANMAGLVVDIKVKEGETVSAGQPVAIIEAMKMENILFAQLDGVVKKVHFSPSETVLTGSVIIEIE